MDQAMQVLMEELLQLNKMEALFGHRVLQIKKTQEKFKMGLISHLLLQQELVQ